MAEAQQEETPSTVEVPVDQLLKPDQRPLRETLEVPYLSDWLDQPSWAAYAAYVEVAILLVVGLLIYYVTRKILRPILTTMVSRTKNQWDDVLIGPQFINWVSWIPVTALGNYGILFTSHISDPVVAVIRNVSRSLTLVMILLAVGALLTGVNIVYNRRPYAKSRPIKGYLQILKIIIYLTGGIAAVALLFDESAWGFITGIGAMTAILLLIFKDTILSLVASVTLATNDMVRVGDWIEMPAADVNGDVVDISLHTVRIQNFDRTFSTVPTYRLVNETVKNYRGMAEAGGRRIMRSLRIDLRTVRFLSDEEIERFSRMRLLREYMKGKQEELASWNAEYAGDDSVESGSRRLTNIGTLRAYIVEYLKSRTDIHQPGGGLMFLIRQLAADEHGVPLEVYVFAKTTVWAEYEGIQGDIFDHIFAMVPEFGLRIFQDPSGADFTEAFARLAPPTRPEAE